MSATLCQILEETKVVSKRWWGKHDSFVWGGGEYGLRGSSITSSGDTEALDAEAKGVCLKGSRVRLEAREASWQYGTQGPNVATRVVVTEPTSGAHGRPYQDDDGGVI